MLAHCSSSCSPRASMRDIIHDPWTVLRVIPDTVAGDEDDTEDCIARKLAVRVAQRVVVVQQERRAWYHHIYTLLQSIRLLGMTSNEPAQVDPVTAKSRQCTWIQNYRGRGREREGNIWSGMTSDERVEKARQLPNPRRRSSFQMATEPKVKPSRRVLSTTRTSKFNSFPIGKRWESIAHDLGHGRLPQGSMDGLRHFLRCCEYGRAAAVIEVPRGLWRCPISFLT